MTQENVKVLPAIGFAEATKRGFKNLFNFKQRSRRSEFWWFCLPWGVILLMLLSVVCMLVNSPFGGQPNLENMTAEESTAYAVQETSGVLLNVLVPWLVVHICFAGCLTRRLHDRNVATWMGLAPVVLFLVFGAIICGVQLNNDNALYLSLFGDNEDFERIAYLDNWLFGALAALVLSFIMLLVDLVICLFDGDKGPNKYGESTKYIKA